MQIDVKMPQTDVNTTKVEITELLVNNGEKVVGGDVLMVCETSKVVYEITAEVDGFILLFVKENDNVAVGETVASIYTRKTDYDDAKNSFTGKKNNRKTAGESKKEAITNEVVATQKAKELAKEHGIDLVAVKHDGVIKTEDVRRVLQEMRKNKEQTSPATIVRVNGLHNRFDRERIAVVGGGKGAEVLIDLLLDDFSKDVAVIVDDNVKTFMAFGREYPVSPYSLFDFADKADRTSFDTVIITMTANLRAMQLRAKLYAYYVKRGLQFTNVIAKQARICRDVLLGTGNVIDSGAYVGVATVIGNNNHISYNTAIGHHNTVGDHNLFAPGVTTSGSVTVGNGCIFPAGVSFINRVRIGNDVVLPVGYAITRDIADGIQVKEQVR
jgi:acetyltransferase-like isoleucine patch superfamily enzyme